MALVSDHYDFGGGLVLALRADRRARAHFRAEYGPAAVAGSRSVPAALEISIGARLASARGNEMNGPELRGVHKVARWRAVLPAELSSWPLRAAVEVRGPLGLSLVQSYIVEPLLSVAAARAGLVLVPSAAVLEPGGALLLVGRSRSGKSTLAARALAAGKEVLGDDQVLLAADGAAFAFPRRLRLYTDLPRTAPGAHAALRSGRRAALGFLAALRRLTGGYVAPPLRVSPAELGPLPDGARRVNRVAVIERAPVPELAVEETDGASAVSDAALALEEQRRPMSAERWGASLAAVEAEERTLLTTALAGVPAQRYRVPDAWPAEVAIGRLARELGIEP